MCVYGCVRVHGASRAEDVINEQMYCILLSKDILILVALVLAYYREILDESEGESLQASHRRDPSISQTALG